MNLVQTFKEGDANKRMVSVSCVVVSVSITQRLSRPKLFGLGYLTVVVEYVVRFS
jgi:hypothetical protein